MRPRSRDVSFLYMAALAGGGGLLSIIASIGIPIWMFLHGHHYDPAFSLFTGWGIAALGGAYGCLHTYWLSDAPPPPPPRGGLPITVLHSGVVAAGQVTEQREQRAA